MAVSSPIRGEKFAQVGNLNEVFGWLFLLTCCYLLETLGNLGGQFRSVSKFMLIPMEIFLEEAKDKLGKIGLFLPGKSVGLSVLGSRPDKFFPRLGVTRIILAQIQKFVGVR